MRDSRGRFVAGESGNAEGRPQGCLSRLSHELHRAAQEILPLWIEAARNGDEEKQKFLLDRGLPRLKAQLPSIEVEIDGDTDAQRIRNLFVAATNGSISPSIAAEMAVILSNAARVEELQELKEEVAALKAILTRRPKG